MKHAEKQQHLRRTLRVLSRYYGALAHFGRLLGPIIGRSLHRNFARRILNNEIKFSRGLHYHIDDAISVAEQLIVSYKRKRQTLLARTRLASIIKVRAKAEDLFQQIILIEQQADQGNYSAALLLLQSIECMIDYQQLRELSPFHAGFYKLVYSKVQMHLGRDCRRNGTVASIEEAIAIFKSIGEEELLNQSLQLKKMVNFPASS